LNASLDVQVRVTGAGHSWSDAVLTDGMLLNLDKMSGLVRARQRLLVDSSARPVCRAVLIVVGDLLGRLRWTALMRPSTPARVFTM
jgi:hypothetical protein